MTYLLWITKRNCRLLWKRWFHEAFPFCAAKCVSHFNLISKCCRNHGKGKGKGKCKGKGKAFVIKTWTRPEGSGRVRLSDFMAILHTKVVTLSALSTDRLYPAGNIPVTDICGDRGGSVVKVLCYKSEGRRFDSSWCQWNFSLTFHWPWGRLSL